MVKKYSNDVPQHKHDCPQCHFLGTFRGFDLYCCDGCHRTLIARFGPDGDYFSCPIQLLERNESYPEEAIMKAYIRSKAVPLPLRFKLKSFLEKVGIRRTRVDSKLEILHLAICHLASILDLLIFFGTLTMFSSSFHSKAVFWDLFDLDS